MSGLVDRILAFQLNIDEEFQGWVLLFASVTAVWLFCLPCYCSGLSSPIARRFAAWLTHRLPVFYAFMTAFNLIFILLIITWLPNWDVLQYIQAVLGFLQWFFQHLMEFATSIAMIIAACIAVAFKDRIMRLLGLDHQIHLRCKVRDCLNCWSTARFRPIELSIWKVEDLAAADIFSANNVFVELFLGYNETMRTRVHNNAGSGCILKETLQLNFDEDDDDENLHIFVRNQKVMGAQELARGEVSCDGLRELLQKARQGGWAPSRWEEGRPEAGCFGEPVKLQPRGRIWIRAVPVHEEDATPTC